MNTPYADAPRDPAATASQPGSRPSLALRVLSGIGGVAILLISALLTFGTCLAAPVGIIAARRRARRRDRPFTRGASWLGAVVASSIAVALALLVVLALIPQATLRQMQRTVAEARDTARAPEWITRVLPHAAHPDPTAQQLVKSPVFVVVSGVFGLGFASAFLGSIAGSAGWLGSVLLGYAFSRLRAA